MLASTVQFSRYGRSRSRVRRVRRLDAVRRTTGPDRVRTVAMASVRHRYRGGNARSLRTQQRAYGRPGAGHAFHAPEGQYSRGDNRSGRTGQRSTHEHRIGMHIPLWNVTQCGSGRPEGRQVLLRKEVIQPHLPVRLPCYDFVPIADPTFDSSLPEGLGHWLRVLPTFVT
jgi:hypothetical protein